MRKAVSRIARDAQRAAEIIGRIRSQFERGALNRGAVDVNEIIPETITLLRDEAARYKISVRTELAADLPQIVADHVQLQQVAMNLIINSIEAMKDVDGIREMIIKSQRAENEQILVSFSDTGIGLPPQLANRFSIRSLQLIPTHRHGASHQPVDHRVSWWALVGGRVHWARGDFSLEPARCDSKS